MSSNKNFGTGPDALSNAARVRPPTVGNENTQPLTAASVYAFETGAATSPGWYTFEINVAFNIVFDSDATITNPTDNGAFVAGPRTYYLTTDMGYCEIMPNANGAVRWWKSSYGKE
jgi:hypothetical protein